MRGPVDTLGHLIGMFIFFFLFIILCDNFLPEVLGFSGKGLAAGGVIYQIVAVGSFVFILCLWFFVAYIPFGWHDHNLKESVRFRYKRERLEQGCKDGSNLDFKEILARVIGAVVVIWILFYLDS